MLATTRRRVDVGLVAGFALVLGLGAAIVGAAADTERIVSYWAHAAVSDGSGATVVEVIDYDFGPEAKRGILRDIPDVDPEADITVSSPTAPNDLVIGGGEGEAHLRIGDPDRTIRGRHRYRIEYPIATLVAGERFSWDAVGTAWTVPIGDVEIHVTAPRAFAVAGCDQGTVGARGGCTVTQPEPGHLVVRTDGIDPGEGVTVSGVLGPAAASPASPAVPSGAVDDPGAGLFAIAIAATLAAGVAAAPASRWVRALGREQVWKGGAADAAFGPGAGATLPVHLVDHEQLADMATIEFASPRGLSAAAGGIVHDERVQPEHQVAWLIECAIRDEVVLEGVGDRVTLRRGPAEPHPAVAERLADILGADGEVVLGKYDARFAKAWERLGEDLERWRVASGLWDPTGDVRRRRVRVAGVLALTAGLAIGALGAALAARWATAWLVALVVGAAVAGAAGTALVRSWELAVRTPQGSGAWLQIESFRRFIADSEARHAEAAAQRGVLRQYTAWAVALGELDHWQRAVDAAAAEPGSRVHASSPDLYLVTVAPRLAAATRTASTAPSSSGGGSGGGVGGGGGGGGGGSW